MPSSDRGHVRFLIFAKAPIAGAVKTRLARDIGAIAATQWYRRCLARTISAAKRAGIDFAISAAPSAEAFRRVSPHRLHVGNQCAGDLGRRMAMAARACHGAAIVVGSDIPDLSPRLLTSALKNVPRFDLLIGPSRDGGYYLIGFRTPAHAFRLFRSVRWSTPYTLTDTLANAPRHWRIGFLPQLNDVDSAKDLPRHLWGGRRAKRAGWGAVSVTSSGPPPDPFRFAQRIDLPTKGEVQIIRRRAHSSE